MPPIPGDTLTGTRHSQSFVSRGPSLAANGGTKDNKTKQGCIGCLVIIGVSLILGLSFGIYDACSGGMSSEDERLAREAEEMAAEAERLQRMFLRSGDTAIYFLDLQRPWCIENYGEGSCYPIVRQLSRARPCAWEIGHQVQWRQGDSLQNGPVYFVYFANTEGYYTGYGAISPGTQDLVLQEERIYDCWKLNGMFPR